MNAPPAGLWCVLSDLEASQIAAQGAAARAAGAAALTLRRPRGPAAAVLAAWRGLGGWRAVHARADWAAAGQAQAVLAGARGLPVATLRAAFPALLVGASVHDAREAEAAVAAGAAFLLFGPVWETPEKAGVLPPRGPAALAALLGLGVPVIAIGGVVDAARVREARAAGAHGCAVLRAGRDPVLLAALAAAWNQGAGGQRIGSLQRGSASAGSKTPSGPPQRSSG